jgi:hypothetical protein
MVTAMVITKTKAHASKRPGGSDCFHKPFYITYNKP